MAKELQWSMFYNTSGPDTAARQRHPGGNGYIDRLHQLSEQASCICCEQNQGTKYMMFGEAVIQVGCNEVESRADDIGVGNVREGTFCCRRKR